MSNVFAGIKNPFHPIGQAKDYKRFEDAIQCAIIAFHRGLKPEDLKNVLNGGRK